MTFWRDFNLANWHYLLLFLIKNRYYHCALNLADEGISQYYRTKVTAKLVFYSILHMSITNTKITTLTPSQDVSIVIHLRDREVGHGVAILNLSKSCKKIQHQGTGLLKFPPQGQYSQGHSPHSFGMAIKTSTLGPKRCWKSPSWGDKCWFKLFSNPIQQ